MTGRPSFIKGEFEWWEPRSRDAVEIFHFAKVTACSPVLQSSCSKKKLVSMKVPSYECDLQHLFEDGPSRSMY